MRTTFNITFYCRESKANREGLSPLEMSININGDRLFLNLPTKYKPNEFNKKRKPTYIQETIDQYRIKANEVVTDLMRNDIPVTANTVREYMRNGGIKSKTIEDLWTEYLALINIRVGVSMEKTVYRKYELSRDLCFEILSPNKELSSIINADMVKVYDTLKAKFKASTAAGYFTKIKTVFSYAIDNAYMKINPFNGIKIDKGHTEIVYLTESEIKALETVELEGYLDRARDLLLFQLYGGGMAYVDMIHFNPKKMENINGTYIYEGRRQKTNIPFTTVILPKAIDILDKYDSNLPFISNQKLNQYAKDVQRAANIKTTITTHVMRKTYATMMINKSVPISTVSKLMGHSSPTITAKIYAHTKTETIATEVMNAFSRTAN